MKKLLEAMHFAATRHAAQRRKNKDLTPYINHPIEVAHQLAVVGGVEDENLLAAAVLHDTIEDTETTYDDLLSRFGREVADWVQECSDDKSLPKQERKRLQIVNAPHKSPGAKQVKIADKTSNLRSILGDPPADWSRQRQYEYFQWAQQVLQGLTGQNQALDHEVLELLNQGLHSLAPTP